MPDPKSELRLTRDHIVAIHAWIGGELTCEDIASLMERFNNRNKG